MNKFIRVCIVAAGIAAPFATAGAAPMSDAVSDYSASGPAVQGSPDAPYQLAHLQGEVESLQNQVLNLRQQSLAQDNLSGFNLDNAADPYNIANGG